MLLCVGPEGAGKTLLITRIISIEKNIDTKTIPTVGVNISTLVQAVGTKNIHIRELGGCMAPIWHNYFRGVTKVIYVVDAGNLIQLGAATLYLLNALSHVLLRNVKVALVFNKIDCPLPRNIKELLGIMRIDELKENTRQPITVFEVSALTNKGVKPLVKWITGEKPPVKKD